jgi:hypothetical protein
MSTLLDTRSVLESDKPVYRMPGRCTNCGSVFILLIAKGRSVPSGTIGGRREATCLNCECDTVVAEIPRTPA